MSRAVVTADDLALAVRLAVTALREVPEQAWRARAGALEWDRWETVEHLSDDLFPYAVQLGPARPSLEGLVPFVWQPRRDGSSTGSSPKPPGPRHRGRHCCSAPAAPSYPGAPA
jgi:hypothetical protein